MMDSSEHSTVGIQDIENSIANSLLASNTDNTFNCDKHYVCRTFCFILTLVVLAIIITIAFVTFIV